MLGGARGDDLNLPAHLFEPAESEARHDRPQLLRHEEKIVDDVLGSALEPGTQYRVLRGDPHRARIEMALAHHDAAARDERSGGKPKLIASKQRRKRHSPPHLYPSVNPHSHPLPQT